MYSDDVALIIQASMFTETELIVSRDISVVNNYLTSWRLRLSAEKTVCSVFHLKKHSANYLLNVKLQPNITVKFNPASVGWGGSFKALSTSCLALAFAPVGPIVVLQRSH